MDKHARECERWREGTWRERALYVPHFTIPVLVQTQRAARVLDEQIQESDFVVLDLRDFFLDDVGDEVAAATFRRQGEGLLCPGHFRFCFFLW